MDTIFSVSALNPTAGEASPPLPRTLSWNNRMALSHLPRRRSLPSSWKMWLSWKKKSLMDTAKSVKDAGATLAKGSFRIKGQTKAAKNLQLPWQPPPKTLSLLSTTRGNPTAMSH